MPGRRRAVAMALVATGAVLVGGLTPGGPVPEAATPRPATVAATYYPSGNFGVNARHDGRALGTPLSRSIQRRWSRKMPGPLNYPVVGGGRVFAAAYHLGAHDLRLYAFSAPTGRTSWTRNLGTGGTAYVLYESGRVFALTDRAVLRAFDARTGQRLWTWRPPGSVVDPTAVLPVVAEGTVYVLYRAAARLAAVRASDGATRWTTSTTAVARVDGGGIAVQGTSVYLTGGCGNAYRLRAGSGGEVWRRVTDCTGGPTGFVPVVRSHDLWLRSETHAAVLSTVTGAQTRLHSYSITPPALAGDVAVSSVLGYLSGFDAVTGAMIWQTPLDGFHTGAVISGRTVFAARSNGAMYGLDVATGRKVWSSSAGAGLPRLAEDGGRFPGLALGEGLLAVSADRQLTVFG